MQVMSWERENEGGVEDICITDYETAINRNPINCAICNGVFYADDETYKGIGRVIAEGIDNPFACDRCREEYEESAAAH